MVRHRVSGLEERLVAFAVSMIQLVDHLPLTGLGHHVAAQLMRSGTAPATHYAAVRNGVPGADCVQRLQVCLGELRHSRAWLGLIERTGISGAADVAEHIRESDELIAIVERLAAAGAGLTDKS